VLPADLAAAEAQARDALLAALGADVNGRWTVEWRFEGLRLLPLALRLARQLAQAGREPRLLFADAGAAALAKRDGPDLAERCADFNSLLREQGQEASQGLLLAVAPSPAEYSDFELLCQQHRGAVVTLNGRLEDAAVGIGSVARQRRRGFVAQWQAAYCLQPLAEGVLRRSYPDQWQLYREDADGFRLAEQFERRPDGEQIAEALAGEAGLGLAGNLRALNELIDGLGR
jgi:hypothetical protein